MSLDINKTYQAILAGARAGQYVSYGELAKASGVQWKDAYRPMRSHLGELIKIAHGRGWPLLSAIVVTEKHKKTGTLEGKSLNGFCTGARATGMEFSDPEAFYRSQQQEVFRWSENAPDEFGKVRSGFADLSAELRSQHRTKTRFAIAPTDLDWFEHIKAGSSQASVNFWTPTPWSVSGLHTGNRLYFMLKSPIRKIGGYGDFVRYTEMTASDAWSRFGTGNGVDSRQELVRKIEHFAEKRSQSFVRPSDPMIGCIELSNLVTLDEGSFLKPEDCGHSFPDQVVKIKYFDELDGIATQIGSALVGDRFGLVSGVPTRSTYSRKDRKGQSVFRQAILKHFGHKCCVTGEALGELLEAAHIQPYIDHRSNHIHNGLCLRVDLHRLFDNGLITIGRNGEVLVSERLNGTTYAGLNGKSLHLPALGTHEKCSVALEFHRANRFR